MGFAINALMEISIAIPTINYEHKLYIYFQCLSSWTNNCAHEYEYLHIFS